jgi:hypothetical protein
MSPATPAFVRKRVTKIRQNCAVVSYAFLHLQPRLTQFFSCKPDIFQGRVSPYSIFFDDQFFDVNKITELLGSKVLAETPCIKMNRRPLVSLKLKNGLTDLNIYFFFCSL